LRKQSIQHGEIRTKFVRANQPCATGPALAPPRPFLGEWYLDSTEEPVGRLVQGSVDKHLIGPQANEIAEVPFRDGRASK
jgi:hypothetical protein